MNQLPGRFKERQRVPFDPGDMHGGCVGNRYVMIRAIIERGGAQESSGSN
jgi:hypothetical protein